MASRDPRIDAYIAKSAEFARPILQRLREVVHQACPQAEEAIKWGMPSFVYQGKILCGMAAFKQHASFGFWKHAQVMGEANPRDGMGSYGKMARLSDVPPKRQLVADIKKAMRLQGEGAKTAGPRKTAASKPAPTTPPDLVAALKKNAKARGAFEAFAPSHKREYIEWLTEAKREDTRARRLAQAVEWIAEGKQRNWKYQNG
ncbi:MAG TPA: YdeI/OmpD-associated family protein [Luteimonas sp.]|nr:YdeI/OmpD-associated family protein [Luteimonas sp.]